MSNIGVICPAVPGHLNPLSCIGRRLQDRGHRVTVFHLPDAEDSVRRLGLEYWQVGAASFPKGATARFYQELGARKGMAALRHTLANFIRKSRVWLTEVPDALRSAGIDLLLVDEGEGGGACVAEHLGLPFITVSAALILRNAPDMPPVFTPWSYSLGAFACLRNRAGYWVQGRLMKDCFALLNDQRAEWGLKPYRTVNDWCSPLAHISQQPRIFDFPRKDLPPQFHYTGPFVDRTLRPHVPFPYDRLDGRPLVYASMGTLQNRIGPVFREIASACEGLDAQLVISLGGGSDPQDIGALPGSPLVVRFAPQLELLARASLTITHSGLNTVLESLYHGVPMVAIPVANDQPGVAARVKWLGAGEVLSLRNLSAPRLRPLVQRVLNAPSYRQSAQRIQADMKELDGLGAAVEIVESVLGTGAPQFGGADVLKRSTAGG